MARHGLSAQRELFAAVQTAGRLAPEVRQALVILLETLLREVTARTPTQRGDGDEQDHA
jgi:hypothetical protein